MKKCCEVNAKELTMCRDQPLTGNGSCRHILHCVCSAKVVSALINITQTASCFSVSAGKLIYNVGGVGETNK